ncbi:MAG: Chromate transport protein ChrA [uncultured Paraburkholderia sp.]|nr:MAG: Chromate transport protein ChrA [uncultured Paraburkholderia sp.]CAH2923946.1 MAG: Chromate transport protein ChrA [uncultured Paraburkholderia sp.]
MDHNLTSLDSAEARKPTLREIFGGFLGLGLISFGGALPLARRALVEQRRWLSAEDFTDLLGLCQFLPGGNVINLSVAVGMRFRGIPGALAGILGLIAGPSLVVIGLGVLYEHTQDGPHVRHLFAGLAAAAAGLLISMAVKILLPLRHKPMAALIAALGFIAIAIVDRDDSRAARVGPLQGPAVAALRAIGTGAGDRGHRRGERCADRASVGFDRYCVGDHRSHSSDRAEDSRSSAVAAGGG